MSDSKMKILGKKLKITQGSLQINNKRLYKVNDKIVDCKTEFIADKVIQWGNNVILIYNDNECEAICLNYYGISKSKTLMIKYNSKSKLEPLWYYIKCVQKYSNNDAEFNGDFDFISYWGIDGNKLDVYIDYWGDNYNRIMVHNELINVRNKDYVIWHNDVYDCCTSNTCSVCLIKNCKEWILFNCEDSEHIILQRTLDYDVELLDYPNDTDEIPAYAYILRIKNIKNGEIEIFGIDNDTLDMYKLNKDAYSSILD